LSAPHAPDATYFFLIGKLTPKGETGFSGTIPFLYQTRSVYPIGMVMQTSAPTQASQTAGSNARQTAGARQNAGATWQHLVEDGRDGRTMQQLLTVRGSEGWELVSAVREESAAESRKTNRARPASWTLFFKRPAV